MKCYDTLNGNYVRGVLAALVFCLCMPAVRAEGNDDNHDFDNHLFFIARSKNKNLVCYNINQADGKLDTRKPLEIYWLNREDKPGTTNGLTFFQKKMAFGYKVVSHSGNTCQLTLNAYPKRVLTICKQGDQFVCTMKIGSHPALLQSIYVQAKPASFISVEYVELTGIAEDTGQTVTEKVRDGD